MKLSSAVMMVAAALPGAWALDAEYLLGADALPSCALVEFKGTRRVVELSAAGKEDSVRLVLDMIAQYCGPDEAVQRYWALDSARHGVDVFADMPGPLAQYRLERYRQRVQAQAMGLRFEDVGAHYYYWGDPAYDSLTRAMATKLDRRRFPELALVYGGHFDEYARWLTEKQGQRPVQLEAQKVLTDVDGGPSIYLDFTVGMWSPGDRLSGANGHPALGFGFGGGYGPWNVGLDFTLLLPWGPYRYQVLYEDTLRRADNFSGPVTGLEVSYELYAGLDWKVALAGTAGWAYMDVYSEDCEHCEDEFKAISGPVGTVSLRVVRWLGSFGQVYVAPGYQYMALDNQGGDRMRGSALLLQMGIGFEGVFYRERALRYWKEAR